MLPSPIVVIVPKRGSTNTPLVIPTALGRPRIAVVRNAPPVPAAVPAAAVPVAQLVMVTAVVINAIKRIPLVV